jgi:cell division septal protein FtsQ
MLAMLAQYGDSGGSGGGGATYGPAFWLILAAVALVLLVLGTWALLAWMRRPGRSVSAESHTHASDRIDRAA